VGEERKRHNIQNTPWEKRERGITYKTPRGRREKETQHTERAVGEERKRHNIQTAPWEKREREATSRRQDEKARSRGQVSDCSSLDRRETGWFYPTDEIVAATVINLVREERWFT
jgi:hypothetical protein